LLSPALSSLSMGLMYGSTCFLTFRDRFGIASNLSYHVEIFSCIVNLSVHGKVTQWCLS
jgi:hypothetical protein